MRAGERIDWKLAVGHLFNQPSSQNPGALSGMRPVYSSGTRTSWPAYVAIPGTPAQKRFPGRRRLPRHCLAAAAGSGCCDAYRLSQHQQQDFGGPVARALSL